MENHYLPDNTGFDSFSDGFWPDLLLNEQAGEQNLTAGTINVFVQHNYYWGNSNTPPPPREITNVSYPSSAPLVPENYNPYHLFGNNVRLESEQSQEAFSPIREEKSISKSPSANSEIKKDKAYPKKSKLKESDTPPPKMSKRRLQNPKPSSLVASASLITISDEKQKSEELWKWIQTKESDLYNDAFQDYLEGFFNSLGEVKTLAVFHLLFEKGLVYNLTANQSFFRFQLDYEGNVLNKEIASEDFKKLQTIIYFFKYFKNHPQAIFEAYGKGLDWVKQIFLLIWGSQLGKIGMPILLKCLAIPDLPPGIGKGRETSYYSLLPDRCSTPITNVRNFRLRSFAEFVMQYRKESRDNESLYLIQNSRVHDSFAVNPDFKSKNVSDLIKLYAEKYSKLEIIKCRETLDALTNYSTINFEPTYEEIFKYIMEITTGRGDYGPTALSRKYLTYASLSGLKNLLEARDYTRKESSKSAALMKIFWFGCLTDWKKTNAPTINTIAQRKLDLPQQEIDKMVDWRNLEASVQFKLAYEGIFRGGNLY